MLFRSTILIEYRSIFYQNGKSRSLADVKQILISSHLEGSGGEMRRSNFGPLDFGAGSLMADIGASEVNYGRGQRGSIGVWGGGSSSTTSDTSGQSSQTSKSPSKVAAGQSDRAHRHKHAAQQYSDATKASPETETSSPKWMEDAFSRS